MELSSQSRRKAQLAISNYLTAYSLANGKAFPDSITFSGVWIEMKWVDDKGRVSGRPYAKYSIEHLGIMTENLLCRARGRPLEVVGNWPPAAIRQQQPASGSQAS